MPDSESSNVDVRLSTASGKYAIVAIALLAIGGAAFNWWYQRDLHRRSLEFWGASRARLFVQAPEVEALRIVRSDAVPANASTAESVDTLVIDGRRWTIVERRRIDTPTQAPGSSHVRSSLVNDKSFDWGEPNEGCQPEWKYALRFRDKEQTATILIALDCPRLALMGTDLRGSISPMVPALKEFFGEQFSR